MYFQISSVFSECLSVIYSCTFRRCQLISELNSNTADVDVNLFLFKKIKPLTFPLSQPRASAEVWATTIRQEPVMPSRKPMCVSGVRTVSGQEADAGPKRQVNWSGSSPCVFCSSTGVVNWPCRLWPGLLHRWPDSANPAVSSENVSKR